MDQYIIKGGTALAGEVVISGAKKQGLAAAVYTQLSDVEDELNGLMSYDRQVVKLPVETVKKIIDVGE